MTAHTSRLYTGAADRQAMLDLLLAVQATANPAYPNTTDLHEELMLPEVQAAARLWEDSHGRLVGFAYVNRYQNLVDVFDSQVVTPALQAEVVAWGVACTQRRIQEKGELLTLDAACLESDLHRLAFLERHGFARVSGDSILMARPLDNTIPEPALPPRFIIRPVAGEQEVDAYVALHRAAFGTGNMTREYRLIIMRTPAYIPELDLVAVAPGGDLAAFCVCQIFPDDISRAGGVREGWTDPIGTHPTYRRRGLAKALILTGMRLLKARGMDTVILGTNGENLTMQRTADSVGFHRAARTLWFSKPVSA